MPNATIVQAAPPSARKRGVKGTDIESYKAKRDFTVTSEPLPSVTKGKSKAPIFVVQKHDASRLHWDFRLEHGGVLWSWAVPKGPSLDPHDKRLAMHVEDHPMDYADFHGTIPGGQYGAGTVETWDRGTWAPVGDDPDADMKRGEIKFVLAGKRLNGKFVLIRLKPRPKEHAESWLLIKEHDQFERAGFGAGEIEAEVSPPKAKGAKKVYGQDTPLAENDAPPAPGAQRAPMPTEQAPQLATLAEEAPTEAGWLNEVKFDGYRMLAFVEAGNVRMLTRNGLDWTGRMGAVADAIGKLKLDSAILDGELVALREDGVSSFSDLQAALSAKRDKSLFFYAFDLLYLNGWDLRGCRLVDRKAALAGLSDWRGAIRYSDHHEGEAGKMRRQACMLGLEGIICKQADAPYKAARTRNWLKVKCQGREELLVIGWTPPGGSRRGLGALQLGFYDAEGALYYAGAVGTGFSNEELGKLRTLLDQMRAPRPEGLLWAGDPLDRAIVWVRPELIAEVQYLTWTADGRLRHATYLGLREDKSPAEIVREVPEPQTARKPLGGGMGARIVTTVAPAARKAGATVVRRAETKSDEVAGVRLTHPDRELWPGITKRDLAAYWEAVAKWALPEIAGRPLALVRCPDGAEGEHFFQKHAKPGFPKQIRADSADGAPYLVIDDLPGLVAAAQVAAIELHVWGAPGSDPLHPDRVIFDLDPGEEITMKESAAATLDVKARLEAIGMTAFVRTSGGKGLHVVSPVERSLDWDRTRAWCRAFAEEMEREAPDKYVASVPKARRHGRILVDWLRNGLGSTAIASFSPRARPGAGVATRLAWTEVTATLDPGRFNLRTVPERLKQQKADPWAEFAKAAKPLTEWKKHG